MTRALLVCVVLLLAGCAGHAPLPAPAVLEPLAAAPAAATPAFDGQGIAAGFYALGLACLAVGAVVDVLLLPAYLATKERDLFFPCCTTMLDLAK